MTLDGCGNEDYVGVVAGRKQVDRRLWPSYRSSDTSPLVGFLRHRLGAHSPLRRVQSHRCAQTSRHSDEPGADSSAASRRRCRGVLSAATVSSRWSKERAAIAN